jgi:hypothetical protein
MSQAVNVLFFNYKEVILALEEVIIPRFMEGGMSMERQMIKKKLLTKDT